jgi:hypothetical protein
MSLLDIWKTTPGELLAKHLWQTIAFAGTGKLGDGNETSAQLRETLSHVPLELLSRWGQEATDGKFEDSGFALQDIVNEAGRRFGFTVYPGTYRGGGGEPYDGVWESPSGLCLFVETKSSDNFTIDLNRLAEYRNRVHISKRLREESSSILLVVGRQGTGDYEDRIKGSRYAFVMRVITVGALFRLLTLKVLTANDQSAASLSAKIFEIFTSPKFTSLDPLVDLVATAPLVPIPSSYCGDSASTVDSYKNIVDRNVADALFNRVRTAGPSGVPKRHLQQRCHLGKSFQDVLNSLTNRLLLRTEKRGKRTFVLLGEGKLKDEILLILADLYEKGSPKEAVNIRAFAAEKGFAADLADKVAAELRAEGTVELTGSYPGIFCFTDVGYQKYSSRIRAMQEMGTRVQ